MGCPATKRAQRERASLRADVNDFDYLRREVATRLTERIAVSTPFLP
jgi:hypothetical protein